MRFRLLTLLLITLTTATVVAGVNFKQPEIRIYDHIFQLGDSFSTGFGALPTNPPALDDEGEYCLDSDYWNFDVVPVGQLADYYISIGHPPTTQNYQPCGGAVTTDLPAQFYAASDNFPPDGARSLFVMTIGGNDARTENGLSWPNAIRDCIIQIFVDCSDPANGYAIDQDTIDLLAGNIIANLNEFGMELPKAHFVVMGYPRLMGPIVEYIQQPPNPPQPVLSCPGMTGISVDEALFLDNQVGRLNQAIQEAVAELNANNQGGEFFFIEVTDYFGPGACAADTGENFFINDVSYHSFPSVPHANSLHPSPLGWDAYWQALLHEHILRPSNYSID